MEKNAICSQFALQFAKASTDSLITSFNNQVGNCGFNSARAAHDTALLEEFKSRGIDVTAVSSGKTISFAQKVRLQDNVLVIAE